ncbi:hypothetical protein [Micromonospora sp. LOL_021]|uniref:hypothetical protein n=1 Tax=Micromonospora sp. LOL_021 TaxID=3345417 RepID=UPI003A8918F9
MTTQKPSKQLHGSSPATARTDEDAFPAPKHRPAEAVKPAAAKLLAPIRATMQKNPEVYSQAIL